MRRMKLVYTLLSLCAIIGVAVWACCLPPASEAPRAEPIAVPASAPIEEFIIERKLTRDAELARLSEIASDQSADPALRDEARRYILKLTDWMERETTIEGVLRARGWESAVATVHEDSANIIVKTQNLTREDADAIFELACRETGLTGGSIKIIPVI